MELKLLPEILKDLTAAINWWREISIPTYDTRLEYIHGYVSGKIDNPHPDSLMPYADECAALADANTFFLISREFQKLPSNQLPKKTLRAALYGPPLVSQEVPASKDNPGNDDARNKLFELEVAAHLLQSGLEVVGFDDVRFEFEGFQYLVECKRPSKDRNFESSLKKAYEQFGKKLKATDQRGLVAIALENVFNSKNELQNLPPGESGRSFSERRARALVDRITKFGTTTSIGIVGTMLVDRFAVESETPNIAGFFNNTMMVPYNYAGRSSEEEARSLRLIDVVQEGLHGKTGAITKMKNDQSPFDRHLEIRKDRIPSKVLDAAIFTNDTMEMCWASARQVFGVKASPEHAFGIYDRLINRIGKRPLHT